MKADNALVIGAGIGGIALAMRLQSMGLRTTLLEKLDGPGGRARVRLDQGFTFDMGPTVLTVPHFIEELFALEPGAPGLVGPDFPRDHAGDQRRAAYQPLRDNQTDSAVLSHLLRRRHLV
jgi:phytoene desaturase